MHTQFSTPRTVLQFVDSDDLICAGCGEPAVGAPPAFWQVCDGLPVAEFSHPDGTALCRTVAGRIVEPVEVTGDRLGPHRRRDRGGSRG